MSFHLSSVAQSQKFFSGVKSNLYQMANDSSKSNWMRTAGPIIAGCTSLVNLASKVSTVGETLIKGLANLLGALFSKNCSALKGLKQLFIQLPIHVTALILSPIAMVMGGVEDTLGMAANPKWYSNFQLERHLDKTGEFDAIIQNKPAKVQLPKLQNFGGGTAYTEQPVPEPFSLKSIMYA